MLHHKAPCCENLNEPPSTPPQLLSMPMSASENWASSARGKFKLSGNWEFKFIFIIHFNYPCVSGSVYPLWLVAQLPQPFNQRTSDPVNAHLTPGPGIYFNAFIHVYSPRAGADNPLGTNVDVNRKPLSLCPFVASL